MSEIETSQPQAQTFSVGALLGGLCISLLLGAGANVIAGLMAISAANKPLGFLVGLAPGAIFILWGGLLMRGRSAFGVGLLIGGCVIALVGGACGAAMVGTSFH